MTIIYNPKSGAVVKDIWQRKQYVVDVNTMEVYQDDQLAKYLLGKFQFLQEVLPEDVLKVKKRIENAAQEEVKTPEEKKQESLEKLTPKQREALASLPVKEASGQANIIVKRNRPLTPEEAEGIPASGTTDRDGVTWVGEGLQDDVSGSSDMKVEVPGVDPGVF